MKKSITGMVLATGVLFITNSVTAMASSLQTVISDAEQLFGGQAFVAEAYREGGKRIVEVEVLSGNQIVEAVFDARSGVLIESEVYGNPRRIDRVSQALDNTKISLKRAAKKAEKAIGPGEVLEAELKVKRQKLKNGKRYVVEFRNEDGVFEVIVNSRNGKVVRIRRD